MNSIKSFRNAFQLYLCIHVRYDTSLSRDGVVGSNLCFNNLIVLIHNEQIFAPLTSSAKSYIGNLCVTLLQCKLKRKHCSYFQPFESYDNVLLAVYTLCNQSLLLAARVIRSAKSAFQVAMQQCCGCVASNLVLRSYANFFLSFFASLYNFGFFFMFLTSKFMNFRVKLTFQKCFRCPNYKRSQSLGTLHFGKLNNDFPLQINTSPAGILSSVPRPTFGQRIEM